MGQRQQQGSSYAFAVTATVILVLLAAVCLGGYLAAS